MECKQATIAMQAALDAGRLSQPPESVRRHLEDCPHCRQFWQEAQAVEEGLRELGRNADPAPSAGLHRRIMATLETEPAPGTRTRRRASLRLATAASLALIVIAGWGVLHRPERPDAPGRTISSPPSLPSIPSIPLDPSALKLAALIETPKQDFLELADSFLASTGGVIDLGLFAQAIEPPPATPTPRM